MSWAAVAVAAGAAISAGVGAASSSAAGKKSGAAASAASAGLSAAGERAGTIVDQGQRDALRVLDPYREKLGDLKGVLAESIQGNLANLPAANLLAKRVNSLNQAELNRLLGKALPGVQDMVRLASNNTLSMLRGEIPADVAAQTRRRAAGAAVAGGFSGSESARALTARDLGLNSLNLMQEGSNSAQRWIQTARTQLMPALFDPTTQLATPQLTLSSILASAGVAKDQAEIISGTAARKAGIELQSSGAATQATLDGQAAQIAADRAMWDSIGKGIQGVAGAAGGSYMPSGAGGGASSAPAIPASTYSGWQAGPQTGTYYMPRT